MIVVSSNKNEADIKLTDKQVTCTVNLTHFLILNLNTIQLYRQVLLDDDNFWLKYYKITWYCDD